MIWFEKYLGKPYQWGGIDSSFDCLTLVLTIVYERFGIKAIPEGDVPQNWAEHDRERYWREALRYGDIVPTPHLVRPEDIVFFRFQGYPSHAGVMVDKNRFIHILEKDFVRVDNIRIHPWRERFWGAIRIAKTAQENIPTSC